MNNRKLPIDIKLNMYLDYYINFTTENSVLSEELKSNNIYKIQI